MEATFDHCMERFASVMAESRRQGDRVGLFAAMYAEVTATVRRRCSDGSFADAVRMERFVTAFAGRYFDAHDAWRAEQPAPAAWVTAFRAAQRWRPLVLQHLVLGMNAHINLDLGAATADLAGGPEGLIDLRPDFDMVNDVLASMVDPSQDTLAAVSPWFGLADRLGARHDEAVICFSLRRARQQGWSLAERLAALPADARPAEIARVDEQIDRLARRILRPGGTLGAGMLVVRLREPWRASAALDAVAPPPTNAP